MSVKEIEEAITQLPPNELIELVSWWNEYQNDAWDRQMAEDADSGRLDALLAEVDKEYDAGLAKPL